MVVSLLVGRGTFDVLAAPTGDLDDNGALDIAFVERMIAVEPWPSDRRFRYFSGWPRSVLDLLDAYQANLAVFNVDLAYDPEFLKRVVDELTTVRAAQGKPFERVARR